MKHAMHCPERIGGVVDVDVKSKAGRRGVRLPDQLFDLLMEHEKAQAAERELTGDLWYESDFMFTQPNGKPIDPRSDHNEWKALVTDAGVRDARLHDARHTAATVLLLLVMEIMGWSNAKIAQRYQHVISSIQVNVAAQINPTRSQAMPLVGMNEHVSARKRSTSGYLCWLWSIKLYEPSACCSKYGV